MRKIFQSYGKYYDIIYSDKDYEKECDVLEEVFRKYSKFMPKTILDCGCGTGGHAIPLAKRGYEVTGVDLSESMIKIAKVKANKKRTNIDFKVMDLRQLQLNKKFNTAICMFAVIDYLTENEDLQKAFNAVRKHVKRNGLFIFDFWYGPAVLKIKPSTRVKTVEKNGLKVIRIVTSELNFSKHTSTSKYHLIASKENEIIDDINESHMVRFFFPQEIQYYLEENSFKLLKISEFLKLNKLPTENTWNAFAIAKAI